MGKTKKPASSEKEEGQKKISSFFQKASDSKTRKSSLFQEVGTTGKVKASQFVIDPLTTVSNPVVLSDSEEFLDINDRNKASARARKHLSCLQNNSKGVSDTDKQTTKIKENKFLQDPLIVPETQLQITPNHKDNESFPRMVLDDFKSPNSISDQDLDLSLVPDTPENTKTNSVKNKRPFSRSYLLSSTEIGSNPIQRAKENRETKAALKKQQLSAARKGLVSVSINIQSKEQSNNSKSEQESKLTVDENRSGVTPTKVSENGFSLKRMAKSGVSPDPKRNSLSAATDSEEHSNKNAAVMKSLDFDNKGDIESNPAVEEMKQFEIEEMNRKAASANQRLEEKRKERVERMEKEKQERLDRQKELEKEKRKKNGVKIMSYQLHGGTGITKSEEKSLKDDEVLDNILDELNSPKVDDRNVKKPSNQLHPVDKVKKQPQRKRYSLENVLKIGTGGPQVNKSNTDTGSVTSVDKVSDLIEKLSHEWTAEDEAFMKEIDKSFDIDGKLDKDICDKQQNMAKPNFENEMCDKKENKREQIHKDKLKDLSELEIQVNKCGSNGIAKTGHNRTEDISENSGVFGGKGNICSKAGLQKSKSDSPEQMIVELTPTLNNDAIAEFGEEINIDEYMTQFDSQSICDRIKKLTPFKDKSSNKDNTTDKPEAPCERYGRHIVANVERNRDHLVLEVSSLLEQKSRQCYLYGNWQDTHVSPGDTVHVLSEFKKDECQITDQSGFVIINPDLLLSGTTVVGSLFCMRRSILKEKFKGCEKGNLQMLYGSILHSVFQEVLRKQLADDQILEEATKIVKLSENLMQIYANDASEEKVMEEVKNYMPQIQSWMNQYTNIGGAKTGNKRQPEVDLLVTKVNDIEENIWSPRLGIKGKIDLTVNVFKKGETRQTTLPLELKTGRPSYSIEHKGQVTLYSMMSSDRRQDPGRGLLLYLKEPSMKVIPADQPSKAGLIQLRNEMAYYISRQVVKSSSEMGPTYTLGTLPDPISNLRACEKCPQLLNCAIYHRDVEGRSVGSGGKGRLIQESLNHLSGTHIDYYKHWCLMLDLETQTDRSKKTLSDIWCLASIDRENIGACFSGMAVQSTNFIGADSDVTFVRHRSNSRTTPLSSIGPVESDSVVISCESLSWVAVCTGFIKCVSSNAVQVLIDREGVERLSKLKEETFRIDHCDSFSTAGMFYTNISQLMANEARFETLRSLIIDRARPEFQNTLSKTNIEKVRGIFKTLNKPQKTAILKVLMSKHYVLIRGYPGTGKTSTIVAMVKVLNILGLSVLLTSYTHSAVDNILMKLKKDNIEFMRLGRVSKIHASIRERCAEVLTKNIKSVDKLKTFFNSQMIVATSCLGTNHPMFTHRTFDVCIVDEASQVLQPACLGPLFCSKRFVLVGDSKQLPPVVQSKEARELGMDECLFVRLDGLGATFDLNLQYRMNSEIMAISNQLIYNNCLKCGSDTVANRVLMLPDDGKASQIHDSYLWLSDILNCSLNKSVVVINTEHIPALESRGKGGIVKNETEANIVKIIIRALLEVGVDSSDIGVIAPYRSQVFLIRNMIQEGQDQMSNVEVNTVDQYQGRDKSVIIISFVRSTSDKDSKKQGELLNDIRRLNVAVTRAKCKLVMIGNIPVLQQYPPVREIIELSRNKQQRYPSGSHEITILVAPATNIS